MKTLERMRLDNLNEVLIRNVKRLEEAEKEVKELLESNQPYKYERALGVLQATVFCTKTSLEVRIE